MDFLLWGAEWRVTPEEEEEAVRFDDDDST
jgi:hypothetical protein